MVVPTEGGRGSPPKKGPPTNFVVTADYLLRNSKRGDSLFLARRKGPLAQILRGGPPKGVFGVFSQIAAKPEKILGVRFKGPPRTLGVSHIGPFGAFCPR